MTALFLQTALLLLTTYFAGAFLACIVRRTFFSDRLARKPVEIRPAAMPQPAMAAPTAAPMAPTRRPEPQVSAPRIETIQRPAPTPMPVAETAARFERALSNAPVVAKTSAPAPVVTAPIVTAPTPVVTPSAPKPVPPAPVVAAPAPAPAPAKPVVAPPPPTAKVEPAPVISRPVPTPAPVVPPPSPAPVVATSTIAAAAAALAAAAAAQRIQQLAPAPVAAPKLAPVAAAAPVVMPTAASASGQGSVAAPVAPAIKPAVIAADDLTLIRNIDRDLQSRLNGVGVRRYSDIAEWRPGDVMRFNEILGSKGRVEQENWIEQAHILAKGGETFYSRRRLRGELPTAEPTPDEGAKPAASPQAADDTFNGSPTAVAPPVRRAATPPRVEERAAFADPAPRPAPAPAAAAPATTGMGAAVAAAAAAAAAQRPAAAFGRDNLQRIDGINGEVEKLLNVQGVSRFAQISGWSTSDITRFDRLLGIDGRIAKEGWIEQAQTLARGGETAYSRELDRRTAEASGETRRPTRLADAIRESSADKPPAPVVAADSATARPRSDISGLRSVRSEAYRTPEPTQGPLVVPAGTAMATAAAAAASAAAKTASTTTMPSAPAAPPQPIPASAVVAARSRAGTPDDLKRIRGVGVLIEKKLNSMGVMTYDQIANWTNADIDRISHVLDFKGRIERENWVEQARILSSGGQTEFSRRVDRGEVETSRSKPE